MTFPPAQPKAQLGVPSAGDAWGEPRCLPPLRAVTVRVPGKTSLREHVQILVIQSRGAVRRELCHGCLKTKRFTAVHLADPEIAQGCGSSRTGEWLGACYLFSQLCVGSFCGCSHPSPSSSCTAHPIISTWFFLVPIQRHNTQPPLHHQ